MARTAAPRRERPEEPVERIAGEHAHVVTRKIADLKRAEYNPRKLSEYQKAHIHASLEEFGMVDFVVINTHPSRENVVVGGHQRLTVLAEMGYTHCKCVEVSLPLAKERELNLRLNKNTGSWDEEMLGEFFSKEELSVAGWDEEELKDIFGGAPQGGAGAAKSEGLPFSQEMAATSDYLVITFKDEAQRQKVEAMLGLEMVRSKHGKTKAMQHVMDGSRFLQILEEIK
jgi:hypothetical protein